MDKYINKARIPLSALGFFLFISIWEIVSSFSILPSNYFPPFTKIITLYTDPIFLYAISVNIFYTLWTAGLGFSLAAFVAIPVGILIGRSKIFLFILESIIEFLRPMPSSAIVPIAILFFGLGWKMTVFVVAFGATWPILVPTVQGTKNIDHVYIDNAILMRLNIFQQLISVIIPASLSYIMAGLRTSLAVSLILAVTAEMIAGNKGIGFYILDMERAFRIQEMYAAIISIGVVGYLMNKAFERFEQVVLFWDK